MSYTPFYLFGNDDYSFMEAVQHYNNLKVAYDGAQIRGNRNPNYVNDLPKDGSVRVKNNILFSDIKKAIKMAGNNPNKNVGFIFSVPVREGFEAKVVATLSKWTDIEDRTLKPEYVLATFSGKGEGPDVPPEPIPEGHNTVYSHLIIELFKNIGEDASEEKNYLQNKIENYLDEEPVLETNRLFKIRVQQFVWPKGLDITDVGNDDYFARDDSLILEIIK